MSGNPPYPNYQGTVPIVWEDSIDYNHLTPLDMGGGSNAPPNNNPCGDFTGKHVPCAKLGPL